MKYLSLLLALGASASALAAPDRISPPPVHMQQTSSYFLTPAVGQRATADVGESLFQDGIRTVTRKFHATLKADVTSAMDRGYLLDLGARAHSDMNIRPESGALLACFYTENTGILGFFGDRNVVGCLVDTGKDHVFTASMFPLYDAYFPLSNPVPYDVSVIESTTEEKENYYADLLYQGLSKGEIKISYREYSRGHPRPAYNQDISYELAPDGTTTIGFKGLRIKVLKATGSTLDYVIETPLPRMTSSTVPTQAN